MKQRQNKFDPSSGYTQSDTITIDLFGNQTRTVVDVQRGTSYFATDVRLVTRTITHSDSTTPEISITRNGLLQNTQGTTGLISWSYYDGIGRPLKQTNPRTDTSTTARIGYVSNSNRPAWQQDGDGNQTSFGYDSAGQLTSITDALSKVSYRSYNLRGQVTRMWGDTTYPVEYGFGEYGDQTSMKTYRAGSGRTGSTWSSSPGTADTTTWAYDDATGTLTSKTDAASHAVSYTYNARGQLASRTWARGVTTTYAYDSATAEQRDIVYSDSTPAVHYTYNRLGQVYQVDDLTGTRLLDHCACGKLVGETLDSTFFGGRKLAHQLDTTTTGALGRTTGFTLSGASNTGTDYAVTYGYDSSSRLNNVALSSGPSFGYIYAPNSNLISSVSDSGSSWSQARTWQSHRDLLSGIDTQFSSASEAAFAYTYDVLGRRTATVETGALFSRYQSSALSIIHGYNDRSELTSSSTYYGNTPSDTSSPMATRAFTYAYDNIGSRTSSAVDGVSSTYSANSLNQYDSHTVPGSFSLTGLAPAAATVTITVDSTNSTATRQGQFYYQVPTLTNSSAPVWKNYTVTSSLGGSITRGQFLAKTPESFTYDDDGNLLQDGRWHYWWDAENRLIRMETIGNQSGDSTAVWNSGVTRQKLEYSYDYLGRRVGKKAYSWGGSSFSLASETRFIYDEWLLIADYAMSGSTFNFAHRYVWGLDLGGSLREGGVGGLLAMVSASGTTHLPLYDGNGNLMGLLDRSDGSMTAQYEYSPFGEPLRATGAYAQSNPLRFSSKYADDETGLLWYGYRFYNPGLGRFLGRDPLGEKGGLHLYAFTRNSPVGAWDSLGMDMDPVVTTPGECDTILETEYTDGNGCTVREYINVCSNSAGYPITQVDCSNQDGTETPPIETPVDTGTTNSTGGSGTGPGSGGGSGSGTNSGSGSGTSTNTTTTTNSEHWSDDDCADLAKQITDRQSSLDAFHKKNGGSYVEDPSLAVKNGAAEFGRLYGKSGADYVSQAVGWAGATSVAVSYFGKRYGGASLVHGIETTEVILSGLTHPTNLGLAGNDLNHGNGMSALGNFAGAAGDLTSLLLTGAEAAPLYGQILAGGSAAIFITENIATAHIESGARDDIVAHYASLTSIEKSAVGKLSENKTDYEKHCE